MWAPHRASVPARPGFWCSHHVCSCQATMEEFSRTEKTSKVSQLKRPRTPCVMKSVCWSSSALLNPKCSFKNCRLCKEWLWRTAAAPSRLPTLHQMRAINPCWTELECTTEQSGVFWWASNGSAACSEQLRWLCQIPLWCSKGACENELLYSGFDFKTWFCIWH